MTQFIQKAYSSIPAHECAELLGLGSMKLLEMYAKSASWTYEGGYVHPQVAPPAGASSTNTPTTSMQSCSLAAPLSALREMSSCVAKFEHK
mmetsp:Transcript_6790/g.13479  ORF Transcript_6790/g.13479 Transcript_6790/m.13479 type:complete len:91 (-) Transcript_6790:51-323(-)